MPGVRLAGAQFFTQVNIFQIVCCQNLLQGLSGVVMKSAAVGDRSNVGDDINIVLSELLQEFIQRLGGIANTEKYQ